jgi:spore coat polysaccharide biosynthesis predicted glycosyltransferase SpsG
MVLGLSKVLDMTGNHNLKNDLNVLFITCSGEDVGIGHLSRSMVICKYLISSTNLNINLCINGNLIKRDDFNRVNYEFIVNTENFFDEVLTIIYKKKIQVIIIDLFYPKYIEKIEIFLQSLKKRNIIIIAIDGLVNFHKYIDLIFIPSISYKKPRAISANIISGWDCLLLNVDYTKKNTEYENSILVLTGGSDVANLGETWPKILNDCLPFNSKVKWIVGPYSRNPSSYIPTRIKIEYIENQSNLNSIISCTKYAITVFGVSFFELLSFGVPTIVFPARHGSNQDDLDIIKKEQIAIVGDDALHSSKLMLKLMKNKYLCDKLSKNATEKFKIPGQVKFKEEFLKLLSYEKL